MSPICDGFYLEIQPGPDLWYNGQAARSRQLAPLGSCHWPGIALLHAAPAGLCVPCASPRPAPGEGSSQGGVPWIVRHLQPGWLAWAC